MKFERTLIKPELTTEQMNEIIKDYLAGKIIEIDREPAKQVAERCSYILNHTNEQGYYAMKTPAWISQVPNWEVGLLEFIVSFNKQQAAGAK